MAIGWYTISPASCIFLQSINGDLLSELSQLDVSFNTVIIFPAFSGVVAWFNLLSHNANAEKMQCHSLLLPGLMQAKLFFEGASPWSQSLVAGSSYDNIIKRMFFFVKLLSFWIQPLVDLKVLLHSHILAAKFIPDTN